MKLFLLLAMVLGVSTSAYALENFQVQQSDNYFNRASGDLAGSDFTKALEGNVQMAIHNTETIVLQQAQQKCDRTPILLGDFQVEVTPSAIHCGGLGGQVTVTANFACD